MRRILNKPPEKYKWLRLPFHELIMNCFFDFVKRNTKKLFLYYQKIIIYMNTKICDSCKLEKSLEDFYPKKRKCKICHRLQSKSCYIKYREKNREHRRDYYKKNREDIQRKYKERDISKYLENKRNNPNHVIATTIRARLNRAIIQQFKKVKSIELLGCSIDECRLYLESKFKEGMSWENYGSKGWHIDHVIPCSYFDLTLVDNQIKCFHYTNLQPLWWRENLEKADRYSGSCEVELCYDI